jgi:SAM-dependent methyltransferase
LAEFVYCKKGRKRIKKDGEGNKRFNVFIDPSCCTNKIYLIEIIAGVPLATCLGKEARDSKNKISTEVLQLNGDISLEIMGPIFTAVSGDVSLALKVLELKPEAIVLDVGTGAAQCALSLALQGVDVVTGEPATDTSIYAGKDWYDKAKRLGVAERITFQPFAAHDMPFPERSFDAVFFFGVLHHIDEVQRQAVFHEAFRVIKPGGPMVFFEPKAKTLEVVRRSDPGHPDAANPEEYTQGFGTRVDKITGQMMHISIFRNIA